MKTKEIGRLITILIILILILGGIFAYLYFGTDLLKTNGQLFFKYLGQIVETDEGFIDSRLTEYTNKKMTGKYEDNGQFSVDMDISDIEEEILTAVNDFNIEYTGKIDNTTRKNEQDITINYSNEVNFPFKYKYANETLALQTDCVSSKYIGIENNNLKEFAEKFGITDTGMIPDTIDFFANANNQNTITFTDEEKNQLTDTYQSVLEGRIGEKEFTKTEENGVVNYSVTLTDQEFVDLMTIFLETLKNDQILLPKIEESCQEYLDIMNQSSEEEVTVQDILQNMIDQLNSEKIEDGTTTITVSQTDRKLTGIALNIDGTELNITKTTNQDTLTYGVEMNIPNEDQENMRVYFNASYQGLEQLATVNENYEMGIITTQDGEEQQVVYNFNCTDTFKDDITIEDFTEDDMQSINDYDIDQISTLMVGIVQRIQEENAKQMEEIGFSEYGNPMMYVALPLTSSMMMYQQASDAVE